ADIVELGGNAQDLQKSRIQAHLFRDHQRVFRYAVGVAARVRVFFVDRSAARFKSSTNCSSSSDMVLNVVASSPISVRDLRCTRWEKSPRAMAWLDSASTCRGLVIRRAEKILRPTHTNTANHASKRPVRCIS